MDKQEAKAKLGTLSEREREVLTLFCQGEAYREIAGKLYLAERTVRVHMGNIYTKLGLRQFEASAKRRELLHEFFCPLLKEELSAPPPEEKALVALSPELETQLEEDEYALVRAEPEIIELPPTRRQRRSCLGISVLLLIVFVLGIGATVFALNSMDLLGQAAVEASPTAGELAVNDESSQVPTATFSPEATTTELLPSATNPPPTNTPQPTPIPLALPFTDNFDNGSKPEWSFFGNWFVTNGQLSVIYDRNDYVTARLDLSGWQNYRVSIDYYLPNYGSANTGETAIFVRLDEDDGKFIGFYQDYFGTGGWAYYPSDYTDPQYFAPLSEMERDMPQSGTIELEVNGNQFTAYVNGIQVQQITISGYDSGVIMLAMYCKSSSSCPSFDNFRVEPIG